VIFALVVTRSSAGSEYMECDPLNCNSESRALFMLPSESVPLLLEVNTRLCLALPPLSNNFEGMVCWCIHRSQTVFVGTGSYRRVHHITFRVIQNGMPVDLVLAQPTYWLQLTFVSVWVEVIRLRTKVLNETSDSCCICKPPSQE
jgi:hypothetical protein